MKLIVLDKEGEIYNGFSLIANFEPYRDGVQITPTKACSIGQYLAALNALTDKGYEKVYEKPFK